MSKRPYHKRFRKLHPEVVLATRALVKGNPWSLSSGAQQAMCQVWCEFVSGTYGLSVPVVLITPTSEMAYFGGLYSASDAQPATIYMHHFSLATLLHEYRHHMQRSLGKTVWAGEDEREEDARAWSLSLFYRAAPRRFRRMVRQGRVAGMAEADL